ncbi:MAG: ATP-binding protein, partial [Verrucomicrobia bacterium]|nr:ATP-binding protein [Verrucomicrobiota bacterium]
MYKFWLESLLFNDETELKPSSLTVIVDPNNVGKSALLREIAERLTKGHAAPRAVLRDIIWSLPGCLSDVREAYRIQRHRNENLNWEQRVLSADLSNERRTSITGDSTSEDWASGLGTFFSGSRQSYEEQFVLHFGHFFVAWLTTEQRLRMVSLGESPTDERQCASLLQLLYQHPNGREIELKIRSFTKEAFGLEIALDFTALRSLHLRVAKDLSQILGDPRDARQILSQYETLDNQGDGIRSFVGILTALFLVNRPLYLIDEPEAFLHPPQAIQIGRLLAQSAGPTRQILIATHSADVLRGILSASKEVTVIRLNRRGSNNVVKMLDHQRLRSIASDALLSSARVFDGLFYHGVVVVEGDRDARFYQIGADKLKSGLDIHFVNADNKQTVPRILTLYKEFGISCSGIVDIDVLNDSSEF